MIKNKTWKKFSEENANEIKKILLELGGIEKDAKGNAEVWKIKISDSEFTYYSSKKGGTLYCNGSRTGDPVIHDIYKRIDDLIGGVFETPTKKFLIGLDESGKGELVGHIILTGVFFPADNSEIIEKIVGAADTKHKRSFEFWDEIFRDLDKQRVNGLSFIVEKIPPWIVDRYNINKIIDVTYQRILNEFLRTIGDFNDVRIVLDDYGVGDTLDRFLRFLGQNGAEVVVSHQADDNYLEAKVASLISKREREAVIKAINENQDFEINNLKVGSGNAGNSDTIKWLKEWKKSGKEWPWFIKKSYKTIRELDGRPPVKKAIPPLNENLLSKEFIDEFNKGRLSVESLSVVCPHCGSVLKSVKFVIFTQNGKKISTIKCDNCDKLIQNVDFTLRYFCGYVLPDSNAVSRHVLSNDLNSQKFFTDFKVLLSSVVRKEVDGTKRGKQELEALRQFHNKGRIKLINVGEVMDITGMESAEKDEIILRHCIENNAILVSGDKSMIAFAISRNIFVIDIS